MPSLGLYYGGESIKWSTKKIRTDYGRSRREKKIKGINRFSKRGEQKRISAIPAAAASSTTAGDKHVDVLLRRQTTGLDTCGESIRFHPHSI